MLGIDVAGKYQGLVDFKQVYDYGIRWVAIKATLGSKTVDPLFSQLREAVQKQPFEYIPLYHWITPDTRVTDQVAHFIKTVGPLKEREGIMIDAEQKGTTPERVLEMCELFEAWYKRPVAVYTGKYVGVPPQAKIRPLVKMILRRPGYIWDSAEIFNGTRPRVFAAYISEVRARKLALPFEWDVWQYTSKGTVPGINTRVDLDRVDNPKAFDKVCGLLELPPLPITPPKDEDRMFVMVRFEGFKNVFSHGAAGYSHLSGRLFEYYSVQNVPLIVSDPHPQAIQSALFQNGLTELDPE